MMHISYGLWNATIPKVVHVAGLRYAITYQPLPLAITSKSTARGGNSLGLSAEKKALTLVSLSIAWNDTRDDDTIEQVSKRLIERIDAAAMENGAANRFRYTNYAASFQDPLKGYGHSSRKHLKETSKKYDPLKFFQFGVPGGFKLFQ